MVKKTSKFEVHSGNTLKASNSKHTKRYCKESFLVRQYELDPAADVHARDLDKELCEWDVGQNDVRYSLNKKGRWQLPVLLKEHIHSDDSSLNCKISILEHHKLKRQADCVSYHSSEGQTVTTIKPSKGYFDQSSIKKRPPKNRDDDEEEPEPAEPEIMYQVYYPCSKKSSITHNPKYIGNHDSLENRYIKQCGKRRVKLTTPAFLDIYNDEVNACEDILEGEDTDEQVSTDTMDCSQEMLGTSQILEVLIDRAFKAKDLCDVKQTYVHPKSSKHERKASANGTDLRDRKSCVVYIEDDLPVDFYPKSKHKAAKNSSTEVTPSSEPSAEPSYSKTMPSSRILITSEAVAPASLRNDFGNKYLEANCHPRKFGIDVTEEVKEICRKRKLISFTQEPWSWIILTYDGVYDNDLLVFRVDLNSELGFNLPVLETLFEMNIYTMREVLQSIVMFVESCSADSIQKLPTVMRATASRPALTFDLLRSLKGWEKETYHSSQSYKMTLTSSLQTYTDVEEPITSVKNSPDFCNICFAAIDPSHTENGPATSLLSCNHWFCNDCWKEHFQVTIDRGVFSLQCPEFDCKTRADHMSVLSLVPVTEYKKFLRHCHDNKLQSESEMNKWCPNPKCGRILRAVNKGGAAIGDRMCVTCDCGVSSCFSCLGEAHWPATCQQAREHRQKLKDLGDDQAYLWHNADTTFVVDVKYCPKCRQPINKNGGCPFMACICGFEFCWSCLTPWPHKTACKNSGKSDKHGTLQKAIRHVDRLEHRPKFYSMSVRHRYHRQPRLLKCFRQNEKVLKATLKKWGRHHISHIEPTLAAYGIKDGNIDSVSHAVDTFIGQIADLAIEIHFVIENTAVVLQNTVVGRNRPLVRHIIERMEFIVCRIEQIFEYKSDQDLRPVVGKLSHLQTSARRCLVSLIPSLAENTLQ